MTKVFKLQWQDQEGTSTCLFSHPNPQQTQEQFISNINTLLEKYGKEYIDQEKSRVSADHWIEFIIPLLSKEYGYQQIQTLDATYSGFTIIRQDTINRYKLSREPLNHHSKLFGTAVGLQLLEYAAKKNILINNKLNENF